MSCSGPQHWKMLPYKKHSQNLLIVGEILKKKAEEKIKRQDRNMIKETNPQMHVLSHLSFTDYLQSSLANWKGEDRKEIPSCKSCLYTARFIRTGPSWFGKRKEAKNDSSFGEIKIWPKVPFPEFSFYLKTLVYSSAFWMMVLNELNCCTDQNNNDQYMASD